MLVKKLFFTYLFEQVKVLSAIQLMWTCYTQQYAHKEVLPQQCKLHALLFLKSVWVL